MDLTGLTFRIRRPALVLYTPAQRSLIARRFLDCMRIAPGFWIAEIVLWLSGEERNGFVWSRRRRVSFLTDSGGGVVESGIEIGVPL